MMRSSASTRYFGLYSLRPFRFNFWYRQPPDLCLSSAQASILRLMPIAIKILIGVRVDGETKTNSYVPCCLGYYAAKGQVHLSWQRKQAAREFEALPNSPARLFPAKAWFKGDLAKTISATTNSATLSPFPTDQLTPKIVLWKTRLCGLYRVEIEFAHNHQNA